MMRPCTPFLAVLVWLSVTAGPPGLAAAGLAHDAREVRPQVQDGQPRLLIDTATAVSSAAPLARSGLATRPAQTGAPGGGAGAEPGQDADRASVLTGISSDERDGDVIITLRGNGRLVASSVLIPEAAPPRLVLDFTGVTNQTPGRIDVGKGAVQRVRVARFSATPLVTRVVLDIGGTFLYRVRPGEDQQSLVVTIGDPSVRARRDDEAQSRAFASVAPAAPTATPVVVAAQAAAPALPAAAQTQPPQDLPTRIPPTPPQPVAPAIPAPVAPPPAPPPPALAQPLLTADFLARTACDPTIETYPISMDFDGVDLNAILRTFSEVAGVNLVIDPTVEGKVNVKLNDVPWNQALAVVLRTNGLACIPMGNIVRIAPRGTLTTELSEGVKLRQAQADEERNRLKATRVVQLSYSAAKDIAPVLEKTVLTPTFGSYQIDEKNNIIILTDLPEALAAAEALVAQLDSAPLQVEIEARIVRTSREFARELGIRWGFDGAAAPELGNTTNMAFPNTVIAGGVAGSTNASADIARLSLGAINGALTLDAALSALEQERKVNILLRPRVVTQNNIKAQITRGQEIPYTTIAAPPAGDGVQILQPIPQVQFKTAALTLAVTPRITASDTVILEVDVDNGSPGPAEANGNRAINTQRVQTVVLVRNEGTTVIGGIYEAADTFAQDRTPGLSRVPLLGRLFRRDVADDFESELLVFITPRILRDGGPVK